jgi:hypothetical protein
MVGVGPVYTREKVDYSTSWPHKQCELVRTRSVEGESALSFTGLRVGKEGNNDTDGDSVIK